MLPKRSNWAKTRLKLHSVLTRENPRLLSTYKTDRSNRKQDKTAGLRPRPESWFLLGHKLIPMIPFEVILFLNNFLWTIWWQLDTKYLMPTTGVIVDIKLKTNIDTNQIGSPSWVQFLVYYLISYCWLQVDDNCLITNWSHIVGYNMMTSA